MWCIVPLAGPDFVRHDGTLKPLTLVDGEPLIVRAITSRPWFQSGELTSDRIIFVLRETPQTAEFSSFLRRVFPGCRIAYVDGLTGGALCTTLVGTGLVRDPDDVLCVDLIDILYDVPTTKVTELFMHDARLRGLIPSFTDTYEKYSYLQIIDGKVTRTVEKQRISDVASAGSYLYRDLATFLAAAAGSIANREEYAYNGALFLCPSFNELIRAGGVVRPLPVENVVCLSRQF